MTTLIDAHAHIGRSLFGGENTVERLLASMDDHEVEQAILVPLKPVEYHFGPENDRVAAAIADHPDRFFGLARVDPWQGERALAELGRAIDDLGLIGLFLNPFEEQFAANDELSFPLLEFLVERDLPLMVAGGYPTFSHPSQINDLAAQWPRLTIIATHGGQINISGMLLADALTTMRNNPNVIMETSGIYREDFIEDTIMELGAERVVWGSNTPYMDQGFETLRVRLGHLDDATKALIGQANIQRIWRLGGPVPAAS
jgi:predicted TIM-barrel fold metal-dependent hydrolase